jgi:predicted alpha/beta hydrolase
LEEAAISTTAREDALSLRSGDGTPLAATAFEPESQPWAAVLIAPAMGIPAGYYARFARWLSQQGAAVLMFDYRGMGGSRFGKPLRGLKADLDDWLLDQDAALLAMAKRWPGLPLLLLGHSLGGQQAAALPSRDRLAGVVGVALGSGYVGDLVPSYRLQARLFLHLIGPAAIAVAGHFPGQRLGLVGDVPKGAMLQWRRWCLTSGYLLDAEQRRPLYKAARFPLVSLAPADDEMLAESGLRMMFEAHGNARVFERLQPQNGARIGHTGFFKEPHRETHWPRALHHLKTLSTS